MLKFNLAAGVVAAAMLAGPALAQDASVTGFYGSLGYTGSNATGAAKADLGSITGRVGDRFTRFLGVEGELSGGVSDDKVAPGNTIHLEHQFAGYAVGYLPILPNADILARVGYGETKLDTGLGARTGDSLNYGIGGQYFVTPKDGLRADWTRFDRQDSAIPSSNAWTISYVRRF